MTHSSSSDPKPIWQRPLERLRRLLSPQTAPQPSTRPGMGALPFTDGVTFRVWAPHADQVSVTGDFAKRPLEGFPLAREAHGLWSADIRGVHAGHTYKYLIRYGSELLLRTDPYALAVDEQTQSGLIVAPWPQPVRRFTLPTHDELVIYELHVGTFADDRPTPPGTFDGVRARLPYLRDLGVNAIELMPVAEFPGRLSWGYNPAHPFAVTQIYGGYAGLRRLVQDAHAHGIAVILDVVYNHFGPENLSLWRFDGWSENGLGGIYFYNDGRSETPWAHTRPDFGRSEVRAYLVENALFWLKQFDLDGLRFDATGYIRTVGGLDGRDDAIEAGRLFLQEVSAGVAIHLPDRILIAEDMQSNPTITQPVKDGGLGFHTQWDAPFVHIVRGALITHRDEDRDMHAVRYALESTYNDAPLQRVIFTESHDEVANGKARLPHDITPDEPDSWFARKRSTLGAGLLLTAPGIPMLFQGQECLTGGWFRDSVPLDWQRPEQYPGIVALWRELIGLRRNLGGVTAGLRGPHIDVFHLDNAAKTIGYRRRAAGGPGDDVIVVANFRHAAQTVPLVLPAAGVWRVRFNSDDPGYITGGQPVDDLFVAGNGGDPAGGLLVPGYSLIILSQDPPIPE